MSLELAIAENTQALRELAQMIQAMQQPRIEAMRAEDLPAQTMPAIDPPKPGKKAAAKKAEPKGEPAAAAPAATRNDTSLALSSVSARLGKGVALQILLDVTGVQNLKEVDAEFYPALVAACEAKLNG